MSLMLYISGNTCKWCTKINLFWIESKEGKRSSDVWIRHSLPFSFQNMCIISTVFYNEYDVESVLALFFWWRFNYLISKSLTLKKTASKFSTCIFGKSIRSSRYGSHLLYGIQVQVRIFPVRVQEHWADPVPVAQSTFHLEVQVKPGVSYNHVFLGFFWQVLQCTNTTQLHLKI